MNLVGAEQGLFSREDLSILHNVGNQAGIALERAYLREHLEQLVTDRTAALQAEIAERKRVEDEMRRQVSALPKRCSASPIGSMLNSTWKPSCTRYVRKRHARCPFLPSR